jgi:hypothetical protein
MMIRQAFLMHLPDGIVLEVGGPTIYIEDMLARCENLFSG